MALTASLVASKTSGPAPLAVFFDATGTTCDEVSEGRFGGVFHQVLADFDYGDDADAAWSYWADVDTSETSGTMYAVITTSSTVPSAAQIAAGTDHNDAGAHDAWSFSPSVAGNYEHEVRNMVAGTTYHLYYVHDAGGATYGSVTTGLSRVARSKRYDTAVAPIGYHLFETPGIYTVTMTCRAGEGLVDTATVEITVTDPDTVYATTDTICVSSSADYTGVPAGATTQTTVPTATEFINKRVLFRRGESFTLPAFGAGASTPMNTQIGAFGPTADGYTDLTYTGPSYAQGNVTAYWPTEITFLEGIRFANWANTQSAKGILFYRVKFGLPGQDVPLLVSLGGLADWASRTSSSDAQAASHYIPRNIFFHECHLAPDVGFTGTSIMLFLWWVESACAGCFSNRNNTQTWRTELGYKVVLQDNRAPGKSGAARNIFKTQGIGPNDYPSDYAQVRNTASAYGEGADAWRGYYGTQYLVYRFNDICGERPDQAQPISLSQQHANANGVWNNSAPEVVKDCIIEKNTFRYDPNLRAVCTGWGQDLTLRNNYSDPSNFYGTTVDWVGGATYKRDTVSYIDRGKNFGFNVDNVVQNFVVGEIATGSSGASAEVQTVSNGGLTLGFKKGSGTRISNGFGRSTSQGQWADNEVITGNLGGQATINGTTTTVYYTVSEYVDDDLMEPYHHYELEDDDATPPGVPRKGFLSIF